MALTGEKDAPVRRRRSAFDAVQGVVSLARIMVKKSDLMRGRVGAKLDSIAPVRMPPSPPFSGGCVIIHRVDNEKVCSARKSGEIQCAIRVRNFAIARVNDIAGGR